MPFRTATLVDVEKPLSKVDQLLNKLESSDLSFWFEYYLDISFNKKELTSLYPPDFKIMWSSERSLEIADVELVSKYIWPFKKIELRVFLNGKSLVIPLDKLQKKRLKQIYKSISKTLFERRRARNNQAWKEKNKNQSKWLDNKLDNLLK